MHMRAHVLLNLLTELGKKDKMQGLVKHLSVFPKEFNIFNNKEAQMRNSIYYIPCINLLLFFSEIVLISSRVKYFTRDNITFSYFTSDDMVFAVTSS